MASEQNWIIVGLGNPGKRYEVTRHNMGYLVVQALAHRHGWTFKEEKRFEAQVAKGRHGELTLYLVLPTTYMNESGRAVRRLLDYYKLSPDRVLVVSDDIDLPFGEMRLREMGSAGGHNGLKSVQKHLGTTYYPRLRMGIGKSEGREVLTDYVLDPFSKVEGDQLPNILDKASSVVEKVWEEELTRVMTSVNTRKKVNTQETLEHE